MKTCSLKNLGAGVGNQLLIVDDEDSRSGRLGFWSFGVAGQISRRIG
jgi:hypothetical protein